jgi:catechol 2,3-dioxygenase-like lactoylglutathione lyase family enzyme
MNLKMFARITSVAGSVLVALALLQPGQVIAQTKAEKGGPVHLTTMLYVTDLEKSVDYYTRLVGLKEATRVPLGPGAFEVILSPSGKDWDSAIGLISNPKFKAPLNHGNAYSRVAVFLQSAEEVDARTKRIADEGYKIVTGPSSSPMNNSGGKRTYRYSHFLDPDGHTVEFTYFPEGH